MSKIIDEINAEQMGKEVPTFGPGDTVVVQVKVKEGSRERQTFSPLVDSVEVKRRGDVRRAKLYYLRGLTGRAARIKEKL